MVFIGRERELEKVEEMYQSNAFQMLVLYGRRRIGKTCLLNEFSKGKNPIFYTGVESQGTANLQAFGSAVFPIFMGAILPYLRLLRRCVSLHRFGSRKEKELVKAINHFG